MARNEFRARDLTLSGAARLFLRHRNARILLTATGTAVAARAFLGRWSRRDAVVPAVLAGMEPFVEWMIHVHVLHQRPRTIRGRTYDSVMARMHRAHHQDPHDPSLVLMPRRTVAFAVPGLALANVLVFRSARPALIGTATSLAALTTYEWTHFLIHSSYRPKTAVYRLIRHNHQLHHFRNERYWFGIVTPVSDQVLGTHPAKDEIPPSPTARSLV